MAIEAWPPFAGRSTVSLQFFSAIPRGSRRREPADGQAKYSITGTPTFIVDGVAQPSGAIPYPEMQKILDAALAKH